MLTIREIPAIDRFLTAEDLLMLRVNLSLQKRILGLGKIKIGISDKRSSFPFPYGDHAFHIP